VKIRIYDPDPRLPTNIKGIKRSATNSAFLTFHQQAPSMERAGASVVVKIWPNLRWHMSSLSNSLRYIRTFIRSSCCSQSPPYPLRYKDFSVPKTSIPSQPVPATVHPGRFSAGSYRYWRVFLYAIPTSQHHWSRPLQQVNMCQQLSQV